MLITIPSRWKKRGEEARAISHEFPFDPTYGYTLGDLLAVPCVAPPADFASFWQTTYRETLQNDPAPTFREIPSPHPGWRYEEVDFTSWGGFRAGGWLLTPTEGEIVGCMVQGHGYGGIEAPPDPLIPGMVTLLTCGRGFGRSARPDLPSITVDHVVHGVASRENYLIRGCVADLWAATTVLAERHPQAPLFYYGASFGGGLGALALPWEPRWQRAAITCPTFGHHPLRVTFPCVGSGETMRLHYLSDPSVLEVLRYYDASSAASLIQTPTFINIGCFDPAVAPPGQFAVYRGLLASHGKHHVDIQTCHHYAIESTEAESQEMHRDIEAWLTTGTPPNDL